MLSYLFERVYEITLKIKNMWRKAKYSTSATTTPSRILNWLGTKDEENERDEDEGKSRLELDDALKELPGLTKTEPPNRA